MSKRAGQHHHARRHPRRGRPRRLPADVPAAEHRHAADVRPRRRDRAVDGEPRLLRAVRARPHRVDRPAGRGARHRAPPGPRDEPVAARARARARPAPLARGVPRVVAGGGRAPRPAPGRRRGSASFAARFHGFYRDCRVISDDAALTQARLWLAEACRIGLAVALAILGVARARRDAPPRRRRRRSEATTVASESPFDRSLVPAGLLALDLEALAARVRHAALRLRRGRPAAPVPRVRRALRRRQRRVRGQGIPVFRDGRVGRRARASGSTSRPAASCMSRSHAGFPAARITFHGNNKSDAELDAALDAGVGRIVADFVRRARPPRAARGRAQVRPVGWTCSSGSPRVSRRTPTSSSRPAPSGRSSASR